MSVAEIVADLEAREPKVVRGLPFMQSGDGGAMKDNAAARLHAVLTKASAQDTGRPTYKTWAAVLDLPQVTDQNIHETQATVAYLVGGVLRDQLAQVRLFVSESPQFEDDQHEEILTQLDHALGLGSLEGGWNTVTQHLTPAVMKVLQVFSQMMPSESPLAKEDWEALLAAVRDLEELVESADVPADLKLFLFKQLDIVRKAIREYPLRGGDAFKDASYAMAAAAMESGGVTPSPKTEAAQGKLSKIWAMMGKFGRAAIYSDRLLTAGTHLKDNAEGIVAFLKQLPPPN